MCTFVGRYYSGSLELPVINGPTEGILLGVALKLFTALVGVDFWTHELVDGVQNNSLLVCLTIVSSGVTLLIKYVVALLCLCLFICVQVRVLQFGAASSRVASTYAVRHRRLLALVSVTMLV